MNIVLIGYRGTGKSGVGRRVAELLGRAYVSTDEAIEDRLGVSISRFVEENGWDGFRDEEAAAIRGLTPDDNLIVDTGGGAVLREENVAQLKLDGWICWLRAEGATIKARIAGGNQRPSLTSTKSYIGEIDEVLAERTPVYERAADHRIDTDGRSLEDVAQAVVAAARKRGIA